MFPMHRLFFVLAFTASALSAADWPEWRGGPARDGVWNESGLPKSLPKDGPKILWKQTIGTGYSGPSVAGERLYVLDRLKPPLAGQDTERVLCFSALDGRPLWTNAYPCALKLKGGYENGPRSSPTVRDGKVYTLGAMGNFFCMDVRDGKILWSHDLRQEFQARLPDWGLANAPLLEGRLVIIQAGGQANATVMAFDRESGKEVWRSLSDEAGYASITVIESGGTRQLIVWTGDALASLDPATGRVFWREPRVLAWKQAVMTPIFHAGKNLLLIGSDRETVHTLQLGKDAPGFKVLWDLPSLNSLHSNPVLDGDHVYGVNHDGKIKGECGEFRCISIATGEKMWAVTNVTRIGGFAHASVTHNAGNGVWYLLNESGELILAEATPQGYRELSRGQLTGKTWSHPAFANRRIFARAENSLVCASLE